MKKHILFSACCLVLLFAAAISAQSLMPPPPEPGRGPGGFAGPGQYGPGQYGPGFTGPAKIVTVEQAKTFAHRTPVIVTGNLVQAVGGNLYLFRDATGEIPMHIGPREWEILGASIGPSEKIEVSGEVHWAWRSAQSEPEIHARFIRKV